MRPKVGQLPPWFAVGQKDPRHRMLQYSEITSKICISGRMETHDQTVGQSPHTGILPHQNDRMYFIDDYDLRSLLSVALCPQRGSRDIKARQRDFVIFLYIVVVSFLCSKFKCFGMFRKFDGTDV